MNINENIKVLQQIAEQYKNRSILSLFDDDKNRVEKLTLRFEHMIADFSKQKIDDEILKALENFAELCGFAQKREQMFSGAKINVTEKRAVLHTALRNSTSDDIRVDGINIITEIKDVLRQMENFCAKFHSGELVGYSGKRLDTIVNIGIGGSDLGPKMVCTALKPYHKKNTAIHFVSNVDSTHLVETLTLCNPETTLFIIASKTFTTEETMTNAHSARMWFLNNGGNDESVGKHFIALSTNLKETSAFGINPDNVFRFWDWVGGRFSLWSAIGLPIALICGYDCFKELLSGGEEMDKHFRTKEMRHNIPIMMAFCTFWNTTINGMANHAVLPYDEYLRLFPAFLQQLEMESNGKYVDMNGNKVEYKTNPSVWGQPGTDSQHSFFQLIHQGTDIIPCDFIAAAQSHNPLGNHHQRLLANFLAQTEALMKGKSAETVREELEKAGLNEKEIEVLIQHKIFEGNRPTTTILCKKIDAFTLGALIAMYEHKVFTLGILWNINSFDQWGVELGKQLAKKILPELSNNADELQHDASTNNLIRQIHAWSNE